MYSSLKFLLICRSTVYRSEECSCYLPKYFKPEKNPSLGKMQFFFISCKTGDFKAETFPSLSLLDIYAHALIYLEEIWLQ